MRLRVPIPGVFCVAFLAMEVGVNPRAVFTILFLGQTVRDLPVTARIMPKCSQRYTDVGRRLRIARDGRCKFCK